MDFSAVQSAMSQGLSTVQAVVPGRQSLGILHNVLVEADEGGVTLTTTDLDRRITTRVEADVREAGSYLVPVRKLASFIGSMHADESLSFRVVEAVDSPTGLRVESARTRGTIFGYDRDEFPPPPEGLPEQEVVFSREELAEALKCASVAMATEDSRPVLQSVHISAEGEEFKAVGADGYRLGVYTGALQWQVLEPIALMLPNDTVNSLKRLLGTGTDPVTLYVGRPEPVKDEAGEDVGETVFSTNPGYVRLVLGHGVELFSVQRAGSYPNFTQLVPKPGKLAADVEVRRQELLEGLTAVTSFDDAVRTLFSVLDGEKGKPSLVRLDSSGSESGAADSLMDAKVKKRGRGELKNRRTAFNPVYVSEALRVLGETEKVKVGLAHNPSSPNTLSPVDGCIGEYLYVFMPIFYQWEDGEGAQDEATAEEVAEAQAGEAAEETAEPVAAEA